MPHLRRPVLYECSEAVERLGEIVAGSTFSLQTKSGPGVMREVVGIESPAAAETSS